MIQFLQQHWRLILDVVLLIASVVILILRKKPTTDIQTLIFEWCLEAVKAAEEAPALNLGEVKKSEYKLAIAVQYVNNRLKSNFPDIKLAEYHSVIVAIIEDILATPQKKEK